MAQGVPVPAVGIYISGSSWACELPALARGWVQRQASCGWKLTPIHVGYQAGHRFGHAAVGAAKSLGIGKKRHLHLDIEHYAISNTRCNAATLPFMEGWTDRIEKLGYASSRPAATSGSFPGATGALGLGVGVRRGAAAGKGRSVRPRHGYGPHRRLRPR